MKGAAKTVVAVAISLLIVVEQSLLRLSTASKLIKAKINAHP